MAVTTTPRGAARAARSSSLFRGAARAGYVVAGILNVAIGVLAISVAASGGGGGGGSGGGGGGADQAGALASLAGAPGGQILIWLVALGLLALGLWNAVDAVLAEEDSRGRRWVARLRSGGKAVAYVVLGVLAVRVALGAGGSGSGEEQLTADALATPGGVVLVVLAGLVALGVGGYLVVKGARQKFLDDLRVPAGRARKPIVVLGTLGYVARGIAIAVIGILFLVAAVTADPEQAGGLDDALATLAGLPFGQVLLVAIALGFVAYGVYSVARARLAKL